MVKNPPAMQETWVGKIPWRRAWQSKPPRAPQLEETPETPPSSPFYALNPQITDFAIFFSREFPYICEPTQGNLLGEGVCGGGEKSIFGSGPQQCL